MIIIRKSQQKSRQGKVVEQQKQKIRPTASEQIATVIALRLPMNLGDLMSMTAASSAAATTTAAMTSNKTASYYYYS